MLQDTRAFLRANELRPNPLPVILFYSARDLHGHYSNFSLHSVTLDGKVWPTTEHYFQAMKSLDTTIQSAVRAQSTPGKAKFMGGSLQLRPDWELPVVDPRSKIPASWWDDMPRDPLTYVEWVKDLAMWRAIKAKFTQHEDLRKALLTTGDAVLVEAADFDPYWGWGPSKTGANKLGFLLMELRCFLRLTTNV